MRQVHCELPAGPHPLAVCSEYTSTRPAPACVAAYTAMSAAASTCAGPPLLRGLVALGASAGLTTLAEGIEIEA